jgi:hypothetical protein
MSEDAKPGGVTWPQALGLFVCIGLGVLGWTRIEACDKESAADGRARSQVLERVAEARVRWQSKCAETPGELCCRQGSASAVTLADMQHRDPTLNETRREQGEICQRTHEPMQ